MSKSKNSSNQRVNPNSINSGKHTYEPTRTDRNSNNNESRGSKSFERKK